MAFGIDGKSEANALGRAVDMPEYKDSFRPAPLWGKENRNYEISGKLM